MSKKEEALNHIKSAENCLKTSFFKRSPDYDSAIEHYNKAAICYRNSRMTKEAADVYLKLAELYKIQNSLFNEAKNFEQAALLFRDLKEFDKVFDLISRAANNLKLNGNPDSASILIERGAKMLEEALPKRAGELYLMAAETCEMESKWGTAADNCSQAARMFVRVGEYQLAVNALQQKVSFCAQNGGGSGDVAAKAIAALVLIHLTQEDAVAAKKSYDTFMNSGLGSSNDDLASINQLIIAFDEYDSERAKQIIMLPTFRYLENDFVKMARTLKFPTLEPVVGQVKNPNGQFKHEETENRSLEEEFEEGGLT